ncbi:2-keto-4-pentenoate hydratase [Pseudodonghicola flavimaris]|uniref:Fumarylacetoacetate hydrolase family protein n=1 Tax=Pseudodonghicola flavimaris TaxID=3050036 RepID=A0ABT7F7V5_9RHOB|nr:fumarylacetoacetate hydrolase family protein [Pseudodonghicola flavimaris]MDK3020685.1 fumarylacetoacetate hydrolase family protein [Pseudodonghicola flavimaris]
MTSEIDSVAAALATARGVVAPYDLPQGMGGAPFADAYALQDAYVAAIGAPVAGYKLAVNGKPQQAHFGVTEPAWARVLAPEVHPGGVVLPKAAYGELCIEAEITAILGQGVADLSGPVSAADARGLIERFCASIELIDQRGISIAGVELGQAIALNVFNAGCVLGEGGIAPEALELDKLHVTLKLDGELAGEATGAAPQDPFEAVAWLLTTLIARGTEVAPGMLVMCGTHLPLRVLDPEVDRVEVTMGPLGSVAFSRSA